MLRMARQAMLVAGGALLVIGLFPGWYKVRSTGHTTQCVTVGLLPPPVIEWQQRTADLAWLDAEIAAGHAVSADFSSRVRFEFLSWSAAAAAAGILLFVLRDRLSRPLSRQVAEPNAAADGGVM